MKKKLLKFLKISLYVLLGLFVLLSIIPYFIPVNQKTADPKNPPFAESRFLLIDGKQWHFRVFKPKAESLGTMLLIHGFSGSTFSWRHNQEVFADSGYQVISVDLPAFGFSEKNKNAFDHSAEAHAGNIRKILDSLKIEDKITVFGHSMGAGVAWAFAGQNPDKTAAVFLVDGAGKMGGGQKRSFSAAIMSFVLKYPPLLRWVDVLAGAYYFKQHKFEELLSSAYSQKADSAAAAGYMQPFLLKNSGSAVIEGFLYSKANPEPDYSKINCPVYLIWGTKDQWVPMSVGEKFIEKFPKAELYKIEDAGHCPMETHTTQFNDYVLRKMKDKR